MKSNKLPRSTENKQSSVSLLSPSLSLRIIKKGSKIELSPVLPLPQYSRSPLERSSVSPSDLISFSKEDEEGKGEVEGVKFISAFTARPDSEEDEDSSLDSFNREIRTVGEGEGERGTESEEEKNQRLRGEKTSYWKTEKSFKGETTYKTKPSLESKTEKEYEHRQDKEKKKGKENENENSRRYTLSFKSVKYPTEFCKRCKREVLFVVEYEKEILPFWKSLFCTEVFSAKEKYVAVYCCGECRRVLTREKCSKIS